MNWARLPAAAAGLLCALLLLLLIELMMRVSGVAEVPLYDADSELGYVPKPNQSGAFMRHNRWAFNELSMGVSRRFEPSARHDVLLVGDSIVLGGNALDQDARLAAVLERRTGDRYWPVSAGSWALLNQVRYLRRNKGALKAVDEIIFVVNFADFGQASSWSCEMTHPTARPRFAVAHAFRKHVLDERDCGETPPHLQVAKADWRLELRRLLAEPEFATQSVTFWLYPTRKESADAALRARRLEVRAQEIAAAAGKPVIIHSVGLDPRWGHGEYADGIHPNRAGVDRLAAIMSSPSPVSQLPRTQLQARVSRLSGY